MKVLQVNAIDQGGGAEKVALSLFHGYRDRGHESWLAVGVKKTQHPDIFLIRNGQNRNPWSRFLWKLQEQTHRFQNTRSWGERVRRLAALIPEPRAIAETWRGYESTRFPGTYHILDLPPARPDILHLHSLSRGYFDLDAIPHLSIQVPTFVTLHDMWLFTGHCGHAGRCMRWQTGCGHCPDLTIPPRIYRDNTAENWQRKRRIYLESQLHVIATSEWMLNMANASMLQPKEIRRIPLGIDLQYFKPGSQVEARAKLNLDPVAPIVLYVAAGSNFWKNYNDVINIFSQIRNQVADARLLIVGLDNVSTHLPEYIQIVPYVNSAEQLSAYYQAADVFLYPVKAEAFGLVVIEASACGLPVVAADVGAIPEHILNGQSGFTVNPEDYASFADCTVTLLKNPEMRHSFGALATRLMSSRYNMELIIDRHLEWYSEVCNSS